MIIKLKPSVVMNLTTEFATGVGYIKALWDAASLGPFIITSADEAIDICTWHHWQEDKGCHKAKLIVFARKLQRAGFRVVAHSDWLPDGVIMVISPLIPTFHAIFS